MFTVLVILASFVIAGAVGIVSLVQLVQADDVGKHLVKTNMF